MGSFEQMPSAEKAPMTKEEWSALAKRLHEKQEGFKFPGLEEAAYAKLKAEGDEYPGMATPIDEVVKRLEAHGMKVSLGDHPESGNVFILPLDSNDVENDSVLPRHLNVTDDMDPDLKELILAHKEKFAKKK